MPHSLRPSAIEGHPIYITARNRMRSSGGHSNETTKSKGRKKERMKDAGGKRKKKRRAAYGRVKKKKEREARTKRRDADGWRATRSSLVSPGSATRKERATRGATREALQPGRA